MSEQLTQQSEDSTRPAVLYHYTSEAGLYGILRSGCIWATHYEFLNDLSERKEALAFFADAISVGASSCRANRPNRVQAIKRFLAERAQRHIQNVHRTIDTYSVSFTNEDTNPGDRLSQWRGYGQVSQAFSLGFNSARLLSNAEELLVDTRLQIPPDLWECIYEHYAKIARVDVIRGNNAWDEQTLIRCMASFKHVGFEEEKEWRLVLQVSADQSDLSLVQFRDGIFGRTPFIEFPLGLKGQNSPLERIVVGPSQHMDQTVRSLEIELKKMRISGVTVAASEIPYRNR